MNWFRTTNINKKRLGVIIGAAVIAWGGLATLIPAKVFAPVAVVLGTLNSVITYLIRSGNYVENRTEGGQL